MKAPEAYYNEIDPWAAQFLRNLIDKGYLPYGVVDERSITDVQPDDLIGFTQCHFFAGIGGWGLAARLAGWPDWRELWTGSCPCQPFSVAGKGGGTDDARHLWPDMFRLVRARRPLVVMGEQVAAAAGKHWLDGVLTDLEGIDYASRALVLPACAINAPHRRDRLWWTSRDGLVGDRDDARSQGHTRHVVDSSGRGIAGELSSAASDAQGEGDERQWSGDTAIDHREGNRSDDVGYADLARAGEEWEQRSGQFSRLGSNPQSCAGDFWATDAWVIGYDGKARRVEPGIRLLAHGVSGRVAKLRAGGNAIVPQEAAECIAAYAECYPV